MNINQKKATQLGMPFGTANNKLKKYILFSLLKEQGRNICFQCGDEIASAVEFSIEHKIPWLDNNVELFWDLGNIAFSHLHCNCGAARTRPVHLIHGKTYSYCDLGCRCKLCTAANTKAVQYRRLRYGR